MSTGFVAIGVGGRRVTTRGLARCSAASRRDILHVLAISPALLLPGRGSAYQVDDDDVGFEFSVPDSYERSDTVLAGGRKLYLYVKGETNVSAVSTPIPGDYQKLTSFGTVENVANTILPKGVEGTMNGIDTKPNRYIFDYTVKPPNKTPRRLLTVFTIRPGRCIVTVTAQCEEAAWAQEEQELRGIIDSFVLRPERD